MTARRNSAMRIRVASLMCALLPAAAASPLAGQIGVGDAGTFLIRGGTIVTGTGSRLENASVLIRDGRIAEVGPNVQAPAGAVEIDARGRFVYPGMMDSATPIGLTEIGSVATMNLSSELGDYNPHNRAIVAINVDSELIGVTRSNGVTHVLTTPSGGVMSGQAAVIHLSGWTWEDMAVQAAAAFVVNYPRAPSFRFGPDPTPAQERAQRERIEAQVRELHERLATARRYDEMRRNGGGRMDLQYEAMRPLVRGEVPALVSADTDEQIRGAITLADSFGIRVIIRGGADAWKHADELSRKRIPIVLGSLQSTPAADAPYDALYAQPGVLHRAGVRFAFSTGAASNARHVPYHAALAVAYGLPADAALSALTIWPAEIFGVADQLGTIEPGKIGNLFIADGDPLDIRTQVTEVFIAGRRVPADDRHSQLYQKYDARPKH